MPGERTLYRKIQVVLDYAKNGKHSDKSTLINYIINRQPTNFIYYYRDKNTNDIVHGYSAKSLEWTIEICRDLKLLYRSTFALTKTGVSASDPKRFPTIIGKRANELLESKGISLNSIVDAIRKILRSADPKPPTVTEIWSKLSGPEESIDFLTFARLMNLLGQSQYLLMSQKRIYLPINR